MSAGWQPFYNKRCVRAARGVRGASAARPQRLDAPPPAGVCAVLSQWCPPELRRLLKFPLDVCATVSPCSSSDPANMEANGSVFSQSPCPHPSQQRVSRQVLYNHTARRVRGPEGIRGASAPVTGRKDRRATARRRWRRADAVTTQVGTLATARRREATASSNDSLFFLSLQRPSGGGSGGGGGGEQSVAQRWRRWRSSRKAGAFVGEFEPSLR